MASDRSRMAFRVLAGTGALIATAWLPVHLTPAAREMTLDFALSFLLTVVVVGLLWWASRQPTDNRLFWSLLAAGWTLNLVGNISWSVYEMVTGQELPPVSWIDALYAARQILVLISLWNLLSRLTNWRWEGTLAIMSAVAVILWPAFRSALSSPGAKFTSPFEFLFSADYPILDTALVYMALVTWACAETKHLRNQIGLLTWTMIFYGIANWIQFAILTLPDFTSSLTDFFWTMTDVMAGLAVVYAFWRKPISVSVARKTTLVRWLEWLPYLAGSLAIGLTVGDLVVRGGVVDPVLTGCSVVALGTVACHYWRGSERKVSQ